MLPFRVFTLLLLSGSINVCSRSFAVVDAVMASHGHVIFVHSVSSIPLGMTAMAKRLDVDRRVSGFMLPLSFTLNRDGLACCQAMAVITIAQIHKKRLTIFELLKVW